MNIILKKLLNMKEVIIIMGETLRICQQNLDWGNEKIEELLNTLLGKEPQVLLFSEFCYSKFKFEGKTYEVNHKDKIVERLRKEGYNFYWPYACRDSKRPEYLEKCQNGLICVMAVKKGMEFKQRETKDITLSGRYIEGELILEDKESINILFVHAPQTCLKNRTNYLKKSVEYYQERVEEKAEMLFNAYLFGDKYKNEKALIGGDLNSEIEGEISCKNIFKALYNITVDTEPNQEWTWKDHRYDYALVSGPLYRCGCKTTLLKTTSDHKALLTEIEID